MTLSGTLKSALKSSSLIAWKPTGKLQKTVAKCIERRGVGLHSGKVSTVRLWPELPGIGRYFDFKSIVIRASIDYVKETPLCTTLCKDGYSVRTIEHLLSALEATGVDNCRIEIESSESNVPSAENQSGYGICTEFKVVDLLNELTQVPIFDGSAREWVEGIGEVGLKVAIDGGGNSCEKVAPFLNKPVCVWKNDSFVAAFPSSQVKITYGIDFLQVPAIGCQWFSSTFSDDYDVYVKQIASSRTFCVYEEVEKLRNAGLINGGSAENAIVCSATRGWLNPPLRFQDEPCRHKILDLIGDISLFAKSGSQGLPMAHIISYKGGHALHADFVRCLRENQQNENKNLYNLCQEEAS